MPLILLADFLAMCHRLEVASRIAVLRGLGDVELLEWMEQVWGR